MKQYYESPVLFDCERMRHRFCGLYSFCQNLGVALSSEGLKRDKRLSAYVTNTAVGALGDEVNYVPKHSWHKYLFLSGRGTKLWHSTYQFSKYRPLNVPILMTIHDLNFLYEESDKGQIDKWIKRLQYNVDRAERVVAISEFTKSEILKYIDIKNSSIDVIYNGCTMYTGEITAPIHKQERPFLFSIGTIVPKKNFHVLPCLLRNNDYDLIIAGSISDYSKQILEEAKRQGVSDRVKLVGTISEAEKHWYYQHCAAFLFPSIAEGFGLPVVEAMCYGKPIFLSLHTSLPEIGKEYAFYFNHHFDPNIMCLEFADGMQKFHSGGIDTMAMRKHALSYSWQNAAFRYWDIYEEIISNR